MTHNPRPLAPGSVLMRWQGVPGEITHRLLTPIPWRVRAFKPMLGVVAHGVAEVVTASHTGVLEWLADFGPVLPGQDIALIRPARPLTWSPGAARTSWEMIHLLGEQKPVQPVLEPPRPARLPPYALAGEVQPKQYKLDLKDIEAVEQEAKRLGTNGSALVRALVRGFMQLPEEERGEWLKAHEGVSVGG